MTPDPSPPSPDDGKQLPPRHRPTLGNLNQDTTELDLWAFEDDLDAPQSTVPEPQRGSSRAIPSPREQRIAKTPKAPAKEDTPDESSGERIKMNVSRSRAQPQSGPLIPSLNTDSDFDDLDNWEDAPRKEGPSQLAEEPPIVLTPELPAPLAAAKSDYGAKSDGGPSDMGIKVPAVAAPSKDEAADEDEFSPKKKPGAPPLRLRLHLGLSMVERLGIIILAALLILGGIYAYLQYNQTLPTGSNRVESGDFPIKGKMITVDSATSYWRSPVIEGPNTDTFRRGTELLPVLVLKVAEGQGSIRVLFRNEEGEGVGDLVTRTIQGAQTLEIAATAGFDDLGMHAAYRTGGSKPWTIEVFEATSESAAGKDIKRLFEINISTDRR